MPVSAPNYVLREPKDFMIDGPSDHGIKGLYNFLGIESPGLTSPLALADALD